MTKKQQRAIITSMVILSTLLFVEIITLNTHRPVLEREGDIPPVVKIDDQKSLYSAVSYVDYQAIQNRITEYIVINGGNPKDTVVISNLSTPVRDGNQTTFNVNIPSLQKNIGVVVVIGNSTTDASSLTVPAEKFSVPLYSH